MKGKTKKIVLAVAVIGAIAAGGVAFTAANTVPASVAGYGTNVVSGTTVTAVHHTLTTNGQEIVSTEMTLSGDQTTNTVKAGFDVTGADNVTCVPTGAGWQNGTPGDPTTGTTDEVCTYPVGPAAGFVSTATADNFYVAVS
jgi:hypothetical protein